MTHKLLGDLASAKMMKLLGHVDCGTLAHIEDVAEEPLELRVNDRAVDGQETRCNLGRKRLSSADETVAEGRGCGKLWVSLQIKPLKPYSIKTYCQQSRYQRMHNRCEKA